MKPINPIAIEQDARARRAEDLRNNPQLLNERSRVYALLLGNSLLSLAESLNDLAHLLLAWNPQATATLHATPALLHRLNRLARRLFAWNPQHRRSC